MNKKRHFALALSLVLCLSLLPAGALATDGEEVDQTAEVTETNIESAETKAEDNKAENELIIAEEPKSLQEQINEASPTATIQLSADITGSITIPSGKNITLDLNGCMLTYNDGVVIKNNGTLTIKDNNTENPGKIVGNIGVAVGDNSKTVIESGMIESVEGAVITGYATGAAIEIKGGTLSASDNAVVAGNGNRTNSQGQTRVNPNKITISGGIFNGSIQTDGHVACGVYAPWKDEITITDGTFHITKGAGVVARAGKVTISGGAFTCSGDTTGMVGDSRVVVPCSAVVFDAAANYPAMDESSKIEVTGGTFTAADPHGAVYELPENDTGRISVSGGTFGDMSFMPFAADGASVKLTGSNVSSEKRITVKKSITLDLGGNTFTSSADYAFLVSSGKSFTLKNGTLKTTNSSDGTGIFGFGHSTITVEKDATLETTGGGIMATNNSADEGHATINVYGTINSQHVGVWCQGPKNTVNLDGAAITSQYFGIYQNGSYGGGTFTIKNSTITDTTEDGAGVYISNSKTNADNSAQGMQTLTIENSKISGATGVEVKFTNVTIRGNQTDITGSGTPADISLNNNGSTTTGYAFALTNNTTDNRPDASKGTVTIEGGSFTGEIGIQKAASETNPDAAISITGGTFSIDPSKVQVSEDPMETVSFVASGYRVNPSGDKWTVSRIPSSSSGGSTPPTTTTTQENEDGSTTTTVTDNRTGTVTETTQAPDGSTTTVETQKDGTVTTTETTTDGSTATTVEKPDGSSQTDIQQADGTTATVVTDAEGATQAQVEVSHQAVTAAQDSGEAVALPIPAVETTQDTGTAPKVEVKLPESSEGVRVEIPVTEVTPGTVAVIVHPDGTEEIVKTSLPTDTGVALTLDGSTTVKIVDNTKPFDDLTGEHWAKNSVDFVAARELFQGTDKTTFAPEEPMTRAMLLTVLARVDDVEPANDETWYGGALDWAVEKGVSDGSNPQQAITREQVATMLYRFFGQPEAAGDLTAFADADRLSPFADNAMRWAVEVGLIKGIGNGILDPQGQATRAQVAAVMERCLKLK